MQRKAKGVSTGKLCEQLSVGSSIFRWNLDNSSKKSIHRSGHTILRLIRILFCRVTILSFELSQKISPLLHRYFFNAHETNLSSTLYISAKGFRNPEVVMYSTYCGSASYSGSRLDFFIFFHHRDESSGWT